MNSSCQLTFAPFFSNSNISDSTGVSRTSAIFGFFKSVLSVLKNDTNDVIEFNSSFSEEIKKSERRNYWDLLKLKWKKKQL